MNSPSKRLSSLLELQADLGSACFSTLLYIFKTSSINVLVTAVPIIKIELKNARLPHCKEPLFKNLVFQMQQTKKRFLKQG